MNIAILGAAGMIGAEIVNEATNRDHTVTAYTRSGSNNTTPASLDDTDALINIINTHDATIISVASRDNYQTAIQAHRDLIAALENTQTNGRLIVVGGAGSLTINGARLVDSPEFPEAYKPEALAFSEILEAYRASGINWTMIAPSPLIAPGERTGSYRTGLDSPVGDSVSNKDFAVALIDELETPQYEGTRFTVASDAAVEH